ncbi:MAG: hypothetical protein ACT4NX_01825 [Deltaproteobacteria bacterium]
MRNLIQDFSLSLETTRMRLGMVVSLFVIPAVLRAGIHSIFILSRVKGSGSGGFHSCRNHPTL